MRVSCGVPSAVLPLSRRSATRNRRASRSSAGAGTQRVYFSGYLVSAWASHQRLALGQEAVSSKSTLNTIGTQAEIA
jgi:hypothetical protein